VCVFFFVGVPCFKIFLHALNSLRLVDLRFLEIICLSGPEYPPNDKILCLQGRLLGELPRQVYVAVMESPLEGVVMYQ
jgi:hypothetical protein